VPQFIYCAQPRIQHNSSSKSISLLRLCPGPTGALPVAPHSSVVVCNFVSQDHFAIVDDRSGLVLSAVALEIFPQNQRLGCSQFTSSWTQPRCPFEFPVPRTSASCIIAGCSAMEPAPPATPRNEGQRDQPAQLHIVFTVHAKLNGHLCEAQEPRPTWKGDSIHICVFPVPHS
jgi:hypothetical protein